MSTFVSSTPEEVQGSDDLVVQAMTDIMASNMRGRRTHVIWDVDHVLISGRSDDLFAKLKFDVDAYFRYEERLLAQPLEEGQWAFMARLCGKLQHSQDIVTARSSWLLHRAQTFLLEHEIPARWQLFLGHQSKKESYRIILESFRKDPDTDILMVDDAQKHVDAFRSVAAELGMADRCTGILAPQIRTYDDAELELEMHLVLDPALREPCVREVSPTRRITVVPDGRAYLQEIVRLGAAAYLLERGINRNAK